jgi:hypothetical protein
MAGLRRKRLDLAAGVVEVAEVVTEMHSHLSVPGAAQDDRWSASGWPAPDGGRGVTGASCRPVGGAGWLRVRSLQWWTAAHRQIPHAGVAAGDSSGRVGGVRIHDLRHTAVALWIAAGAGPKEVATRAGHTSVSFTLDRYGHLYPEADRELRDRLDRFHEAAGNAE